MEGFKNAMESAAEYAVPETPQGRRIVFNAALMVGLGFGAAWLYHGTWRNTMTEFLIWGPANFGLALIFSKTIWDSLFCKLSLTTGDGRVNWKGVAASIAVMAACLHFVATLA